MHERDLQAEHAAPRLLVDQLGACALELCERRANVRHLVGDVMHPGAAARDEPPDGRIVAERGEQLDAAVAESHRGGLDALVVHALAVLQPAAEHALVRGHRLVEIGDRKADVVNPARIHGLDGTVAPMPRRFALAAAVLFLAGCGGGVEKTNGEADKPAAQVVADAQRAATSARSVHVSGSIVDDGRPLTLDLELARGKGGKGTMSEGGLRFDIVRVGSTAYIKGSNAFLRQFAGPAAQLLRGRWLKGPTGKGELGALAPLTSITQLFAGALGSHGKLVNKGETQYKGRKVVAIRDTSDGGTLYVAAVGKPYPVAIVGGTDRGRVRFDDWNEPVTIAAPRNAIDLTTLGKG